MSIKEREEEANKLMRARERCAFLLLSWLRDSKRVLVTTALLEHGKRIVVRARVESWHAITLVSLLECLFDGLDVNTSLEVVLAVVFAESETVLDMVVVRCLSSDGGGLVVSTGAEKVGSLGVS